MIGDLIEKRAVQRLILQTQVPLLLTMSLQESFRQMTRWRWNSGGVMHN